MNECRRIVEGEHRPFILECHNFNHGDGWREMTGRRKKKRGGTLKGRYEMTFEISDELGKYSYEMSEREEKRNEGIRNGQSGVKGMERDGQGKHKKREMERKRKKGVK